MVAVRVESLNITRYKRINALFCAYGFMVGVESGASARRYLVFGLSTLFISAAQFLKELLGDLFKYEKLSCPN